MDFQPLIKAYLASDSYLSVSQNTKKSYAHLLARLQEVKTIPEIENDMQLPVAVAQARSHLNFWSGYIRSLEISNSEKNRSIVMLKVVYTSLCIGHLVAPLKMYMHTKGEAHPITLAQVEAIWNNNGVKRCWRTLLRFSFYSGMRPSEVRSLLWKHVGDEFITVIGSKGREKGKPSRMVAITHEIRECLVYAREWSLCEYVFTGACHKRLSANVVCLAMQKLREKTGTLGVLYDARRGIAREMDKRGVNLFQLRDFLGHKNVKTTEIYLCKTMMEKAMAVR